MPLGMVLCAFWKEKWPLVGIKPAQSAINTIVIIVVMMIAVVMITVVMLV
jgi:hypothetical protein